MHAIGLGERTLTDLDFSRLSKLPARELPPTLVDLLAYAEVVSARAVAADVVTMHSRAEVVDVHTRQRQVVTLCYPADAQPAAGFVSVLSPVGSSLLGLKAGEIARWLTPMGEACAAEIAAIQYQPEACGDYAR